MQNHVINEIKKNKIIVIVRGVAADRLIPLAQAMYDGGIRLLECTYDASGRIPNSETAASIARLAEHFEGKMMIGAGTVLTEEQVRLTHEAGGRFIISPDTNPDVIRATKACSLVSIPGALTPTEAVIAHRAGADFVKLFPIDAHGVGYLKAISAPLSHIKFLAVGGIDENNMTDYLAAGACGVGVGSCIVNKKLIEAGRFDEITALAKRYTAQLQAD